LTQFEYVYMINIVTCNYKNQNPKNVRLLHVNITVNVSGITEKKYTIIALLHF